MELSDRIIYTILVLFMGATLLKNSMSIYVIPLIFFFIFCFLTTIWGGRFFNSYLTYFILILPLTALWACSLFYVGINADLVLYYVEVILFSLVMIGILVWSVIIWKSSTKWIEYCDKVLAKDPEDCVALNNKGVHYSRQMKYLLALECFNQVLNIDSNYSAALNNKGVILRSNDPYLSEKYINKALELDPGLLKAKKEGNLILNSKKRV